MEIEDVIILTSQQPEVPVLTEKITAIRKEEKVSLEELLEGLDNERKIIYKEKYES